ncbi:hypothetical protein [Paenibacillus sp. NEAU-GSW1]|uniref:hypothetical protein n=1 Tax=Paenibacillus sp. NEAU-GSW1 TaxID=2682486 RepID=UPI0012E19D98|nr:hypothetical protein [Paenibacillus sp. NEAU-GSW1]MUT68751.1 hypothetical protein [Paenibacillus sp. NEAU-GSW1]
MRQVTIHTLRCRETEDWGADECRLEIFVDGALQPYLRKSLDNGQSWSLNRSFKFNNKVEVKLWDEDSPDPNDHLGSVQIGTNLVNNAIGTYKNYGSSYELNFSVINIPDTVNPVDEQLQSFEKSTATGVWPNIVKSELIADIKLKIANPFKIDQASTPLCGPASILFELVSRHPAKYVAICRELFETGKFTARTKIVKPSSTLLNSRVRSGVSVADWMLMATLRDTENALFPVEANSNDAVTGLTTPWEMKGWTFEILGFSNVAYESTYVYGEFEAMRKAKQIRDQGGVAFLMIHAAMLGNPDPAVGYPNHWVSYLSNLKIDEGVWYSWDSGHINFDCYSWGSKKSVNLGEGPFEDYMFGLVTGVQ